MRTYTCAHTYTSCPPRCGCAEGLEAGRHCLNKWGFKRIEDICWIKVRLAVDLFCCCYCWCCCCCQCLPTSSSPCSSEAQLYSFAHELCVHPKHSTNHPLSTTVSRAASVHCETRHMGQLLQGCVSLLHAPTSSFCLHELADKQGHPARPHQLPAALQPGPCLCRCAHQGRSQSTL